MYVTVYSTQYTIGIYYYVIVRTSHYTMHNAHYTLYGDHPPPMLDTDLQPWGLGSRVYVTVYSTQYTIGIYYYVIVRTISHYTVHSAHYIPGPATWLWSRGGTFGGSSGAALVGVRGRSPRKIFRVLMQRNFIYF